MKLLYINAGYLLGGFTLRDSWLSMRKDHLTFAAAITIVGLSLLIFLFRGATPTTSTDTEEPPDRTIHGTLQARPGGPVEEVEVKIHNVPVDLPSVTPAQSNLSDDDLVVGIVVEGQPMAYPVRYLAQHEVVDHRVGSLPVAPTW
jgi:hypothetical protein